MDQYKAFARMLRDGAARVKDTVIYQSADRQYELFQEYTLIKMDYSAEVWRHRDETSYSFNHARHAVAWAIMDHHDKFDAAHTIQDTDRKIGGYDLSLRQHQSLLKNSKNSDEAAIYYNKIDEDRILLEDAIKIMNKLVEEADKLQENAITKTHPGYKQRPILSTN